ncbi:MAG: alpha-2-macroglobulin, partial [Bacteroidaceae bacterium]|nr:alpha-2-macroglobulin [Bacteroidaceae bacterium]
ASAYYANALLAHLVKAEPRIADSLKVDDLDVKLAEAVLKLKDLQLEDGSWSWYKGMSGSVYMTTAITQLLARLQQMTGAPLQNDVLPMYRNAAAYLYKQVEAEVQRMDDTAKRSTVPMLPCETTLQYLYIHALDKNVPMQQRIQLKLMTLMTEHPRAFTIYGKALSAIIFQESGKKTEAKEFLESLMQYSVMTEEMGRYFNTPKAEYSWFSYRIPTQVAVIEAVKRIAHEEKTQEEMKQWLLKQKQAQVWETPIATADAVYALLTTGSDWLQHTGEVEIVIGKSVIKNREGELLGYVNQEIPGKVMDIRKVTVRKASEGIGWGAVYAEFEEELDKVQAQGNALQVTRTLYQDGKPLAEDTSLQVGDRLIVRLAVTADRDMDFVEVKDNRAACLEPVDALSGYRWAKTIGYYQETKDASTSFYVDRMPKGTHWFEYEVYVMASGEYQQGIATVRSVYAPEFGGHGTSSELVIHAK